MDNKNKVIVGIAVILMLGTPKFVCGNNEDVKSAGVSDPNDQHVVDNSVPAEEEKHSESDKNKLSQQESNIIEYFEKTKSEILSGRKFSDQSTPANALLTLMSAYYRQDLKTLEQIFPVVKQEQFKRLSSPEVRAQMLAAARDSILCRIEIEDKPPEESDLCAIYTRESPEKPIDQVWSFAYVEGAWRFAGSTSSTDNWRTQAIKAEALTRDILSAEAEKAKATATDTLQQEAGVQDSSEDVQGAPKPDESTSNCVLSLDGQKDYVRIADSQSLHSFSNAITIEVWVKASSYAENDDINSIIRKNVTAGAENFLLRIRNINDNLCVQMSLIDIGLVGGQHEFTVGKWYHLAGTYDGSAITVLVNGVAVESGNLSGPIYIDKSDLFIGKGDPEFRTGEYFHGALDEIRIWNVARSQEEIRAAMNAPLTGKEEGLVVYLNFDDGTAKDLSGHGNDGLLSEEAKIVESPHPASVAVQKEQPNKLIAWWKLDEADGNDVADSSGNAYGGRLIGNPQWQPVGGKVNGALVFDGVGDYIEIDNESTFDLTGPITIAAWIKVNSFDKRWQAIVTKGDTAWRLHRTAEEDTLAFHCTGIRSARGRSGQGIEGNKKVNDGKWHHAVGVYDGSTVSLYIDGVLDNSSEASGSVHTNDAAVFIGANSEVNNREWNGLIDEVCIIGGAIDASAVDALYSGEDSVKVAQTAKQQFQGRDRLLAWWKFDDDVNDSAGAYHGVIQGNPTYAEGKIGRAINLDGDDYVNFGNPDSLNFGTGDWTISAWIKTTLSGAEVGDRGTVFAKGGDEAGGIRYALAINEAYSGMIVLTTDTDTHKVQAVGRTAVNDDNWHHVVGIRNAGQLQVYVDGVLDGDGYLSDGYDLSGTSQHNAYIGAITDNRDSSLYKYFVGMIDEVCIIRGAIDAVGVRSLYSGEDPATVARMAIVARAEPQPTPRPVAGAGARGDIEGDWEVSTNPTIIQIRRKSDGALTATAVPESPDVALPGIPLDEVTFENGTLRFKLTSQQAVFEGTMKEDGLTIEGQYRQQGQIRPVVLKRIVAAESDVVPVAQEPFPDQTSGTTSIATTLILVLVLAGIVAAIVLFLVKSSIRR